MTILVHFLLNIDWMKIDKATYATKRVCLCVYVAYELSQESKYIHVFLWNFKKFSRESVTNPKSDIQNCLQIHHYSMNKRQLHDIIVPGGSFRSRWSVKWVQTPLQFSHRTRANRCTLSSSPEAILLFN